MIVELELRTKPAALIYSSDDTRQVGLIKPNTNTKFQQLVEITLEKNTRWRVVLVLIRQLLGEPAFIQHCLLPLRGTDS